MRPLGIIRSRRWSHHGGINAFRTGATGETKCFPNTLWGYNERTTIYKPGIEPSPDTRSVGTLTLDFPVTRTVRSNMSCVRPLLYDSLLERPKWMNSFPWFHCYVFLTHLKLDSWVLRHHAVQVRGLAQPWVTSQELHKFKRALGEQGRSQVRSCSPDWDDVGVLWCPQALKTRECQ